MGHLWCASTVRCVYQPELSNGASEGRATGRAHPQARPPFRPRSLAFLPAPVPLSSHHPPARPFLAVRCRSH
jgi:hypothetical protein